MYRQDVRPNPLLLVGVGSALVAVFVADAITPLGIIVWIFYLVPVALTLYSWNPSAPIAVATASTLVVGAGILISGPTLPGFPVWLPRLNRALGLTAIWIVALLVRRFITTQIMLRDRDRIRDAQTTLGPLLQGEQSVEQLGARLLTFCCERIGAAVATLYVSRGQSNYEWCTSYAGEQLHGLRPSLVAGDGLCGQAIRDRRILCFADIPEGYLPIASSLGSATPRQLVAVPFVVDDQVVGVAEFGLLHSLRPLERELLSTVAESVAMAIRSAQYRTELAALLEETRQQAEELRTQQEELQATNELLASHGRALEASQARLEQQQAQLESTNVELEVQTASLEQQRDQLSLTHAELVEKAEALERASHFKSEFLANMSHELRTPLNSALILAKLLESNRDGHLSPEEVGYAATIYSAGSDLLVLINDILDLSRIEAGRLELHAEDVVLASMLGSLNTTFEPVAAQKGLTFEVRTAPNLPATLRTDDLRLQQILRNLLANAFKFTRHGSVVLSVSLAAPELLRFSVTDTGIGIPAAAMDVIFDAFRQADGSTSRNYGGTGLGLTISRELARRLGGTLSVESEVGRGSAFTLLLPLVVDHAIAAQIGENPTMRDSVSLGKTSMPAEAVGSPSVPDDRERLSPTGRTILVVEDDARFAAILRDLARERHFQAIVATNASDGLDLAERYRPSAILLDVHLPDHSGLALLEQLKRHPRTRPIPVHVVSVSDHAQQALELGAIGYALKPIQREQLGMALTRLEHKLDQCLRRVLIVEDSEPQRASIDALLKRDGVEMVSVGT
ncbi:MAG TPA: ATP-binding protein, partial [Polyangiaceae bacterium]